MTKAEKIQKAAEETKHLLAQIERQNRLITEARSGLTTEEQDRDVVLKQLCRRAEVLVSKVKKTQDRSERLLQGPEIVDLAGWEEQIRHALDEAKVEGWLVTGDATKSVVRACVEGDEKGRWKVIAKPRGRHAKVLIPNNPATIATVLAAVTGLAKAEAAERHAKATAPKDSGKLIRKRGGKSAAKRARK